jgi:hypothetical protein
MLLAASFAQQTSGAGWLIVGGIAFVCLLASPRVKKAVKSESSESAGKPSTGMWVLWVLLGAVVVGAGARGKADLTAPSTPSRPPAVTVPRTHVSTPKKTASHKPPSGGSDCKGKIFCVSIKPKN